MPTVSENLGVWNGAYQWSDGGDEWSEDFGGTEALWWFALYPRIHRFLPTSVILEIAPGYGRWTQFLIRHCQSLIAIDISSGCIEHCKTRFATCDHAKFFVNDGSSLAVVPDQSVDFVFSFDSLVHAEREVIKSYLSQLGAKLKPEGVGFIHHSNTGSYPGRLRLLSRYRGLPAAIRKRVFKESLVEVLFSMNTQGWRAQSMTADLFRQYCQTAGLKCTSQELINWHSGRCLIDTLSVFTKPNSQWDRECVSSRNSDFVKTAALTARLARLYCR
jgi:hypothetical protein